MKKNDVTPKEKETIKGSESVFKKPRKSEKMIASVTGMRDILPQDQKYWRAVRETAEQVAKDYGYGRIDTPAVERVELFLKSLGPQSDLVEKEMYHFIDQGGDHLCLRPEFTASVVRSYNEHGLWNKPQPVKFFYFGPVFRHEKPQSGRYRQFYQFGFEAIGETNPALDAQLILMGWNVLNELGLEATVQVNSIGCSDCRSKYRQELAKYYKEKSKLLCEDCKKRLARNPLRLLDCKNEACVGLRSDAPQILDYLDDDCKNHFMKVVGYLDELALPYIVNPLIVRGLDYYTKTVFEYWSSDDAEGKSALGGGGRYDKLVKFFGGKEETPACGLAMGADRIVAKIREKGLPVTETETADVFVAQLGEASKKKAMALYEKLRRRKGISLAQAFYKDSLKNQLEQAGRLGVKFTLILGQKEFSEGTIILRDMDGGVQEIVDFNKIEDAVVERLARRRKEGLSGVDASPAKSPAAAGFRDHELPEEINDDEDDDRAELSAEAEKETEEI